MLWYINSNNFVRLKKHYTQVINGASAIIFAGGGIIECSTNHDYYHHIDLLTKIADKRNIPVYFNAVGRVVDSKHMFGWNIMRRAAKQTVCKSVSCRDGVEWINSNLLKRGK